jgi:hypothetical protein
MSTVINVNNRYVNNRYVKYAIQYVRFASQGSELGQRTR